MPKPRSIDPSFWDDPDIATLTRDERLLLIGMITSCADDEGRLLADPGYLRKRVFGYDDDVTRQEVHEWRNNIIRKCRNVNLYGAAGQEYVWFCNWQKHQNMRYVVASKLPTPPDVGIELEEIPDTSPLNKEDYGKLPKSAVNSPSVNVKVNVNDALSSVVAPKKATSESASDFDPIFENIWQRYPTREGAGKIGKDATKALVRALGPSAWPDVLKAVINYSQAGRLPVDPIRFFKSRDFPNGLWREFVNGGTQNGANRQSTSGLEIAPGPRPTRSPGLKELLDQRASAAKAG